MQIVELLPQRLRGIAFDRKFFQFTTYEGASSIQYNLIVFKLKTLFRFQLLKFAMQLCKLLRNEICSERELTNVQSCIRFCKSCGKLTNTTLPHRPENKPFEIGFFNMEAIMIAKHCFSRSQSQMLRQRSWRLCSMFMFNPTNSVMNQICMSRKFCR